MELEFDDPDLLRLYTDERFTGGFAPGIVKAFRRRMQDIAAAPDERTLTQLGGGARFKKLQGDRSHQRSMRLNDQYRLIVEVREGNPGNTIVVKAIEDYHN